MTDVTAREANQRYNKIMSGLKTIEERTHAVSPEALAGHWLLAKAGKKVLRPGGAAMTETLLRVLHINSEDTVIELAPGMGHTAAKVLACGPSTYLGVDREAGVVRELAARLERDGVRFVQGTAEDTGLPGETASVLFGEAMLSMQSDLRRREIVEEAWRVMRCHGRYGIHELCVAPYLSDAYRGKMEADIRRAIRHPVRLLTAHEWRILIESVGFRVGFEETAPMQLLQAHRIVKDEGILGALRFAWNAFTNPRVLRRVLEMRRAFNKYQHNLQAIAMVCHKEY